MMQPTFIKTSQAFINLAYVESADSKGNTFRVWVRGAESPYKFTGPEAEALNKIFNTIAIFDATKDEAK